MDFIYKAYKSEVSSRILPILSRVSYEQFYLFLLRKVTN